MHHLFGAAGALHGRPWPSAPVPSVSILFAERPAVVFGSTQTVASSVPGFEVVRRHSGGGAVLMRPGGLVWADVLVPSDDPLWTPDVGRAFWWLGETWVAALSAVGVEGARWHDGPLVRTRWSEAVCFAGLGPGEVTVDGRKVVGMSQRRRRDAALFQCAALLSWDAREVVRALGLKPAAQAEADLADAAAGLGVDGSTLEAAFLDAVSVR